MTRQTSIDAYNEIKTNGLLSKRRWEVFDILYRYGPLTGSQVTQIYRKELRGSVNSSGTQARLPELRDAGVVEERGEIKCPITGNRVILWDVTDKLPKKIIKPKKTKCPHCKGRGYLLQQSLF